MMFFRLLRARRAARLPLIPFRRACLVPLAVVFLLTGLPANASARERLLLVGNSFTAGVRNKLRWLARSGGHDLFVSVRAADGWTLENHLESRTTPSKIRSAPWNWVVLQEQSSGIWVDRYPAARGLAADAAADGASTVFFMTWRDRDDDILEYNSLRGVPGGEVGYVPIAFELGAAVAPIGWAFRDLLLEDPAAALWAIDGHHASERGRYLASLVLYATIYHESPVGLWAPPTVPPEDALHDQLLVENVVLANPAEWNIDAPPLQ